MTADPKEFNLDALPAEHREAVQAFLADNARRVAELEDLTAKQNAVILRQESLIAELKHALYGKKSEKLSQDERNLGAEDLEVALSETEEASSEAATQPSDTEKKAKPPKKAPERNIGNLPEDLPRIEQVIEPDSVECPCGRGAMHKIGEANADTVRGAHRFCD